MKKIMSTLLAIAIAGNMHAKGDLFTAGNVENKTIFNTEKTIPWDTYLKLRGRSQLCIGAGLAAIGVGTVVVLFSQAGTSIATVRDPVEKQRRLDNRRKGTIAGVSICAASLPLFLLGIHYRTKGKKAIAFNIHTEPVFGYLGGHMQIPAIGLRIRL